MIIFLFIEQVYTNLYQLRKALLSGEVRYVIIDSYTAGANSHIFDHPLLRVGKVLEVPRTYGFVLSGDLVNVATEFRDFINVNEKQILEIMKNTTEPMRVSRIVY